MRIKKSIVLVLAVMLMLTGCGEDNGNIPINEKFGGDISLFAYAPDTLNPLLTKYAHNAAALSVMYESVMVLSPELDIKNGLAEDYLFSEDGKSCTFRLRQGVEFTDGSELTSQNIINSMELIRENPESIYYRLFEFVDSYSASGDYAFTVNLKKGGSSFLSYMNFPVIKNREEPVGTGVYRLAQENDEGLILTAVSEQETNIETVNIRFYPAEEMRVNSFLTNETDAIMSDFYTLAQLTARTDCNMTEYVSDYFTFLGFNNEREMFQKTEFKKAISSLIDKEEMTQSILVAHAEKTNSPYKPGTIYHKLFDGEYIYDKELAIQYLEKCGFEETPSFGILVNSESPAKIKTAEYICTELESGGIDAHVVETDYDTYIKRITEGAYDAFIGEYTMALDYELDFMLGEGNVLRYEDDTLKNQLAEFSSATDVGGKKQAAEKIQRTVVAQLPLISLYYRTNVVVTDQKVCGSIKPLSNNMYNNFNEWYIK